ncbi:hypothetical protein F5Y16DRAFT_417098 [Xylariaceae sp. FL0255]|nr:hypothetical protein F5Y16DRAFT_417098 [Xylariaceae sp. FL0255]
MANYLHHIRDTYDKIFRGVEQYKDSLDVDTVLFLQYKCPSASTDDRELIQSAMRRGQIFVLVPDSALRSILLANILSLQVVIPSIRSYHQNMKYFSIAAKILQDHVECPRPRGRQEKRPSLPQSLYNDWTLPERSVIQTERNKYKSLNRLLTPQLSFVLLFLDTLRDFARLSDESPLQDIQGERMVAFLDGQYLERLRQSAKNLGFRNAKLSQGDLTVRGDEDRGFFSKRNTGPTEWRGGKPPISAYQELASCSFLPILNKSQEIAATPSVAFVQNDFIRSFFGIFDIGTQDDVEMEDRAPLVTDISTVLSPSKVEAGSRQDKRAPTGYKARVKKRGQPAKKPLDPGRLEASLTRPTFDFSIPMALQRQERRIEGYTKAALEVEMTPAPNPAPEEPETTTSTVLSQMATDPSNVPTGVSRRSIQVPRMHPKLPRLPSPPPRKLGKRPRQQFETDGMSVDIRPRVTNFKRARFIENQMAAIREDQQPQTQGDVPREANGVGQRARGEIVRSIQVPRSI